MLRPQQWFSKGRRQLKPFSDGFIGNLLDALPTTRPVSMKLTEMLLNKDTLFRIYDSLPVASCLISRSLAFVTANRQYANLMRTPLESIVGRSMIGLNPPEHIANVRRDFEALEQGKTIKDHEIQLWDGTYLVAVCPIYDDHTASVAAISVTLTNITRHKNIETRLTGLVGKLITENKGIRLLSETDALTMLGNRRAFDSYLEKSIRNSQRRGSPVSLLMMDVDNFKPYNDLYGHLAGDQCLKRIAASFGSSLRRPYDVAARYGGEEFAAILPNTPDTSAATIAHSIQNTIATLNMPHPGSLYGFVTLSIGISTYHPSPKFKREISDIAGKLLEAADTALYQAKESGRNRVVTQALELH